MIGALMNRVALLTMLISLSAAAQDRTCAVTAQAAAQASLGEVHAPALAVLNVGFRAHDLVIDLVLHRVWVRVESCSDAAMPMQLVAFNAPVQTVPAPIPVASQPVAVTRVLVIHAGDAITVVLASPSLQMHLQGTAEEAAELGAHIRVRVQLQQGEPARRVQGIVRDPHTVEVTP